MSTNISAFGTSVVMKASRTFPAGVILTQFADDIDPLASDNIDIGEMAMNINGDGVYWSKANPVPLKVSAIVGTDDHRNLQTVWDNNRPQRGRRSAADEITFTITYSDGRVVTLSGGMMVNGPSLASVGSDGRQKGVEYSFMFAGIAR